MRTTLRHRVEALEANRRVSPRRLLRYGWLEPLPPDWQGERHVVMISRKATRSPWVQWCEWEERIGPAPSPAMPEPDPRPPTSPESSLPGRPLIYR